jgi:DNA-binding MarR family transcriptional regulator
MAASTGEQPSTPPAGSLVVATIIELLRAASAVSAALTPVARRFGLSLAAFNVLHTLARADGPLSPTDISRQQVIRPQTLSDILGTLEQDGLIDRLRDPQDRRMLLVALTDSGLSRYQACCEPLLDTEARLLRPLDPGDLAALHGFLGQIAQAAPARPADTAADVAAPPDGGNPVAR